MTWRIKRVDSVAGANSGLDCSSGTEPLQITMENTATGEQQVVNACVDTSAVDPCEGDGMFHVLSTSYPDNDFGCS